MKNWKCKIFGHTYGGKNLDYGCKLVRDSVGTEFYLMLDTCDRCGESDRHWFLAKELDEYEPTTKE